MAELSVEISAKVDKLLSELKKAKEGLSGIGVAAEKLVDKLKNVGEKMSRIGKSMTTYLTLPLAAIAGASIKMASDFTESLNKVDVAFKSSSKEVRKFAETTLETFGIAEGTALDMAALFGDMATSMGVPTDKAADLSTAMVGLAGDLSSFKNINIKEVTTALNGVFTGETESLKRLGIVMTQTNLKQFALSQGMSDNIEVMTQAQKVQLRYAYILEKTKNAQGDFARTSDGSANQMRIFTESVKELTVAFGEILLPYFTKAITYVNGVVKAFTNLSPITKKVIVVVAALVAVIGPLLIGLGFLMTTVLPGLIVSFAGLSSAVVFSAGVFKTLTTVMLANPIALIVASIAALVLGFTAMVQKITPAVSKLKTFFNLIKSAGSYSRFVALQMDDQVSAMIEQGKAAKISATELERFNKQQEDASIAAKKLTDNLLKQKTVLTGGATRIKATGLSTTQAGVSGDMGQESTLNTIVPKIDTTLFDQNASQMMSKLNDFNNNANDIITNSLGNTFLGIGRAIGDAMANGGNLAQGLGKALLGGIGGMLTQLGQLAIGVGVGIKGIKLALKSLNPAAAIGAGVALIALGSVFSAGASKIGDSGGSSGGGSGSGQTGSSNFSGSSGGGNFGASSGGGMQNVVFRLQGTDLVGSISNTLARNRNLGGSLSLT